MMRRKTLLNLAHGEKFFTYRRMNTDICASGGRYELNTTHHEKYLDMKIFQCSLL
ncbi:hypothetical protein [Calothrix sp. CCY 0018]|uniref:hypothetical protein n=1 Tax=Calothrix sp. CCY 0018 TaxID=3103864 RepID=UPI0039C5D354